MLNVHSSSSSSTIVKHEFQAAVVATPVISASERPGQENPELEGQPGQLTSPCLKTLPEKGWGLSPCLAKESQCLWLPLPQGM